MFNDKQAATTGQSIPQSIFTDRIKVLNQSLICSIPANLICTLIVFFGLSRTDTNAMFLIFWLTVALFAIILHGSLFCLNHFKMVPLPTYFNLLIGIATLYGILWGVAGSLLMPIDNLPYQMLVILIIIGVASGGAHTFQASMFASVLFFIFTILPLDLWFFAQKPSIYPLLGIALLTYLSFMLMVSWLGNKLLCSSLRLKYENLDLIDQLYKNNAVLEESDTRFRSAFDYAAIGMALVSLEGRWLKVNKSLCKIVGYTEAELLKIDFQTITYPDDLDLDLNYVRQLLSGEIITYQMEKRYIRKDKSIIWVLLNVSLLRDKFNKALYFIAQIQNIDLQKRAEQELTYIAHHDVLTGIANRKQLEVSFEMVLNYAKRHNTRIAIMFLDIDGFKEINDQFGHDIGDWVLIEFASRIKTALRATDLPARLGGDEFIVVLTEIANTDPAIEVAKKILGAVADPMIIKQHRIAITCSIGISMYPENGHNLNDLIKRADMALYKAKSEGKNNFTLFDP